MSTLGRKLDAILAIGNVDERIAKLAREAKEQDPDQALFELFVGASYVEEGWTVQALPERAAKTLDFEIRRGSVSFEVECERFARRGEYTELDRDAWLRRWELTARWLVENKLSYFFTTLLIHEELTALPSGYLCDALRAQYERSKQRLRPLDSSAIPIRSAPTDYARIAQHLRGSPTKCQSSAERDLVTGRLLGFDRLREQRVLAHRRARSRRGQGARHREAALRSDRPTFRSPRRNRAPLDDCA